MLGSRLLARHIAFASFRAFTGAADHGLLRDPRRMTCGDRLRRCASKFITHLRLREVLFPSDPVVSTGPVSVYCNSVVLPMKRSICKQQSESPRIARVFRAVRGTFSPRSAAASAIIKTASPMRTTSSRRRPLAATSGWDWARSELGTRMPDFPAEAGKHDKIF